MKSEEVLELQVEASELAVAMVAGTGRSDFSARELLGAACIIIGYVAVQMALTDDEVCHAVRLFLAEGRAARAH